jgi:hypothetical protein
MKADQADALERELLETGCSMLNVERIAAKHGLSTHWIARFIGARGIRARCRAQ